MDREICCMCTIEKHIEDFYNKYTDCEDGNAKRSLKRYYENKDEISNQRKLSYDKNTDKLLQKQKNTFIN